MLNPKNELLSPECPGCELMRYAYQIDAGSGQVGRAFGHQLPHGVV